MKKMLIKIFVFVAVAAVGVLLWAYLVPPPSMDAYLKEGSAYDLAVKSIEGDNGDEGLEEAVGGLLAQMTLDEKIHMLSGHTIPQTMRDMLLTGRNYNVHALSSGGCRRLGVPPILFTDGPRGVVMGRSTCFPVSSLRAATFDTDLEYRFGKAIADEAIAQGANYFAGICVNLVRNPRWGRSQESYGEDQFLLGEFGATLTRSIQEEGMIACPKHFALNSIEDLRFFVDVSCDERTLHEVYLPHFRKCVDAGAESLMGAYNRFDGDYCCENKMLLHDILRVEWGFDGFVMSDFVSAMHSTDKSLKVGLDVEMMFGQYYTSGKIRSALKDGSISEGDIDRSVSNILRASIRQFPKIRHRNMDVVGCGRHRELALEIAQKGMVLLKNDGVLPLSAQSEVMVCGPYADVVNVGDYGSSRVHDADIVTPLQGFRNYFDKVSITDGDVAVICVGSNASREGEFFASMKEVATEKPLDKGGDRISLRLADEDIALIKKMKALGKKTVVVLYSGGAIITEEWKDYADAVIMNFYSGCEGGNALASLVSGECNFSGRLPFTVARTEADYPPFLEIGDAPYEIDYGYYHGYALLDKEGKCAEYPFGFGLSYTTFEIGASACHIDNECLVVSAEVSNMGTVTGAEVVQVYVGSDVSSTGEDRPVKQLKGFARIELAPGEVGKAVISIPLKELSFRHDGRWVMDAQYSIYVGVNAEDAGKRRMKVSLDRTL